MTVSRLLRISLRVELALLGVLATTGVWLTWFFRPSSLARFDFLPHGVQSSVAWGVRVRALHALSGSAFIWMALVVVCLCIARVVEDTTQPRSRIWILAAVFAVAAWGTSFTGFLLPWDQLALKAITIGTNVHGMWTATYGHNIRFVLLGSTEITQHTLRNWFLTHCFVLPPLLLAALVAQLQRTTKD